MAARDTSMASAAGSLHPTRDNGGDGTGLYMQDEHMNGRHINGLHINDVTLIRGDNILQRHITHHIAPGNMTVVTGPNGCGKSSLLRAVAGRLELPSGEFASGGLPGGSIHCSVPIIYVGHTDGLSPVLDGRSNLANWAAINNVPAHPAAIDEAVTEFKASGFASLPVAMLSRGQRRRIALCRLLLGAPGALWLLDEPNVGLDSAAMDRLDDAIARHLNNGGMVLAATHLPLGPKPDKDTGKTHPAVQHLALQHLALQHVALADHGAQS